MGFVDEFIEVMTAYAEGARSESGCLCFDLVRDQSNSNKFTLYEVFKTRADVEAHERMPHVKSWAAFQLSDEQPVLSKRLLKTEAIDFSWQASSVTQCSPIAVLLELDIEKEHVVDLVDKMTANANGSRTESGCMRFDILRDTEEPRKFVTYEVFESQQALDAHKEMPYVKTWDDAFLYNVQNPILDKALSTSLVVKFH